MSYRRFGAMIATSTVVMFLLMYLNTYALDHAWFSQTRLWMALMMGACMAVVMLLFMLSMYRNATANVAVVGIGLLVFAGSLWLVRSQETVDDVAYMKAMIPHHSIAVLTSSRAHIRDPRVRTLADGIIEAQLREIAQMERLIADLQRSPVPDSAPRHRARDGADAGVSHYPFVIWRGRIVTMSGNSVMSSTPTQSRTKNGAVDLVTVQMSRPVRLCST